MRFPRGFIAFTHATPLAAGTITALDGSPLRLRIDVTPSNAAGETIRLTGEAGFHYDKVTKTCVS